MKFRLLAGLVLCAASGLSQGPVIRTVAGNGGLGPLREGAAAVDSPISFPNALAFDRAGNLYIASSFGPVYRMTPDGALFTAVAGPRPEDFRCSFWAGMALDPDGRVLLADMGCNRVVRYDGGPDWTVVAGTGRRGFAGDGGAANQADLNQPSGLAFDTAGNLYIADYGNLRIRVVRPDGSIATYAGSGRDEHARGDGGAALEASLRPVALAVDPAGNLYVADFPARVAQPYYANHSIRKITSEGLVSTVAASSPDNAEVVLPMCLAVPEAGLVYFGDMYRVRAAGSDGVRTIAGSLASGFAGDGGPAAEALLFAPQGLAVDAHGDIYVADIVNRRVRKIDVHQ